MPRPSLKIVISGVVALECAKALEYKAQMEAGQSQSPDLFDAEDTIWWDLAKYLRVLIREAKQVRATDV